jgi:hypothetical protein
LIGRAFVENFGWEPLTIIENGNYFGTTGRSLRLEGLQMLWVDGGDVVTRNDMVLFLQRLDSIQRSFWGGMRSLALTEQEVKDFLDKWNADHHWSASPGGGGFVLQIRDLIGKLIKLAADNPPDGKGARNDDGSINELEGFDVSKAGRLIPADGSGDLPGRDPSRIVG